MYKTFFFFFSFFFIIIKGFSLASQGVLQSPLFFFFFLRGYYKETNKDWLLRFFYVRCHRDFFSLFVPFFFLGFSVVKVSIILFCWHHCIVMKFANYWYRQMVPFIYWKKKIITFQTKAICYFCNITPLS